MTYTLGEMLKRIGVTRETLYETLAKKYNWSLGLARVMQCCRNQGVRNTPTWDTIRLCVKEEFGIEYKNSRWEVTNYGNEKENR